MRPSILAEHVPPIRSIRSVALIMHLVAIAVVISAATAGTVDAFRPSPTSQGASVYWLPPTSQVLIFQQAEAFERHWLHSLLLANDHRLLIGHVVRMEAHTTGVARNANFEKLQVNSVSRAFVTEHLI